VNEKEKDDLIQDEYAIRDVCKSGGEDTIYLNSLQEHVKIEVLPGTYTLVVKEEFKDEVANNPQNYTWIDNKPYPTNNATAKHFEAKIVS